ncbi:MAG TPA: ATP-binding protein [Dehalococcoidia bacterium]|nr:ATP-binding protein [Dehalococcoidia bacterium]
MRVMLVEDSPGDARLVEELLKEIKTPPLTFETVSSLALALPRLAETAFDVLLLDLGLPDSQGLETLIKARQSAPHMPIVVLTGFDDEERAVEAMQLGAQDYLVKGGFKTSMTLRRAIRYAIERSQVQAMLRETMQELEARTEEMEAFTNSVSHDLKEPLRTIEAFSQFLLEDCADALDDQGRDYLGRLAKASARLKNMIEELLILSRLGRRPHELEKVDMAETVAEIVSANEFTIKKRRAVVNIQAGLPPILADQSRVEQVFGNLIGNALKFNRSDRPAIEIGCDEGSGGFATFYVRDNGIGIDPAYHDRIFGIFQRLHVPEEFEGTGAGLAIVKRAVEALGGSVSLESGLGLGSTFYLRLPLWKPASEAPLAGAIKDAA